MYLKVVLFCYMTLGHMVESVVNFTNNEIIEDYDMETCLVDILLSKSQFRADLAIINNDIVSNDLIRRIHQTANVKLYIKDYNVSVNTRPSIYIIHVQDYKGLKNLIDAIDRDWYRKPEALFIIILSNISEDNFVFVFKTLWEYHIIHVLVISDDLNEIASVYTYFPYAEGRCGRDYNNTVKLCDCKNATDLDIIGILQENDKPVLKNCTLQIATHHYPPLVYSEPDPLYKFNFGIERMLLELLLEVNGISWNYTFYVETDEYGDVSDNFTVSGKLEYLYENTADLVFGGFALNQRRAIFFDYICNHFAFQDNFVVTAPSTGLVERWKIIYKMFSPLVCLSLLLTLVLCSIILSDFCVARSHLMRNRLFFEIFRLFGNMTLNVSLNLRQNIFKNCIIVPWLWFTFLIQCYYQTRLTSFSTYQSYEPQLNKIKDISRYKLTPCIALTIYKFLKNCKEFVDVEFCENEQQSLNQVSEFQSHYIAVTHYTRLLFWLNQHPNKKNRVHLLKETVHKILNSMYFKRGFPLIDEYNAMMLRFVECGFVEAIKRLHHIMPDETVPGRDNIGSLNLRALKLKDLSLVFYIFITGMMCALLALLFELFYTHKNKVKNKFTWKICNRR